MKIAETKIFKQALASFFKGLPEDLLNSILEISIPKHFQAGEIIFEESSPGFGFYLLIKGKVKIYKLGQDGKEQILHIMGPGDPFGEVAVFLRQTYPAHALALTESSSIFFPKENFFSLITENPEMALGLLGVMARRLIHLTSLLEDISLKEVPARLAKFILQLAGDGTRAELKLSKKQLASLLAATPESLSRSLGRLKKENLIEEKKPFILIKNKQALQELSKGNIL